MISSKQKKMFAKEFIVGGAKSYSFLYRFLSIILKTSKFFFVIKKSCYLDLKNLQTAQGFSYEPLIPDFRATYAFESKR